MKTIVPAKENIAKLWGHPKPKDTTYRLMRYVLRVDHDNHILLHNVVTGQLITLDSEEKKLLEVLPSAYISTMEQLIETHFLVTIDFDEQQQVSNLRMILRRFSIPKSTSINHYSILPTTACNARCYYCFEHGSRTATMSEQTADDVVGFITNNCDKSKKVSIQWFGGEPTVASGRISKICQGLRKNGIDFASTMITNGYLFDVGMVAEAKNVWNLKSLQISVDGTEINYNRIKAYFGAVDSPYKRILQNIRLLIENGIYVGIRMNYDVDNADDFAGLIDDLTKLCLNHQLYDVYAYPVIGEYPNTDGLVHHGSKEWFESQMVKLNDYARSKSVYRLKTELPSLAYCGCYADDPSYIAITPGGGLVCCIEQFGDEEIVGDVCTGIADIKKRQSWHQFSDYDKCVKCMFYPSCVKLEKCLGKDNCTLQDRNHQYTLAIKRRYDEFILQEEHNHDFQ